MILVNNSYNKNSLFENCKFLLQFSITQEILDNISEDIVKTQNHLLIILKKFQEKQKIINQQ